MFDTSKTMQYTAATAGEAILYSGRDDNQHAAGVALILKKGLKNTRIEWAAMLCSNDVNDVATNGKFIVEVRNRFQALDDQQETGAEEPIEEKWSHIKEAYHAASENIPGVKRRCHKEWISLQTLHYIKLRRALRTRSVRLGLSARRTICALSMPS
ncbi:hypothetical protein OS493_030894 [Desmophyllum pertusum]|uniref:Uncharacterized protein n=1 Tax=Desmophyllum pertusum TaxID=174260 RepID=A0A9X0CD60_9CNID|nr:hypothetical protein OS493_030894 [Desmophyllum pertusum]